MPIFQQYIPPPPRFENKTNNHLHYTIIKKTLCNLRGILFDAPAFNRMNTVDYLLNKEILCIIIFFFSPNNLCKRLENYHSFIHYKLWISTVIPNSHSLKNKPVYAK